MGQQQFNTAYDVEAQRAAENAGFSEKNIRHGFIRKVFGILALQLLISSVIIGCIWGISDVKSYVRGNQWVFWAAWGISLPVLIVLVCFEKVRRTVPINYIMLFLFTIVKGVLVGVIAARYDTVEVVIAFGITVAAVLALSVFAIQTKWDFTMIGGGLFVALIVLIVAGIVGSFLTRGNDPVTKWWRLGLSAVAVIIFSLYLIYDIQLIMGGKRNQLGTDEYICGALMLYIDIVQLFLNLLSIVGILNN